MDAVAIAPDGQAVYVLARDAPSGPVARLVALDGEGGDVRWKTDLNATRALLAADYEGVAVATDFPRAFVTYTDEQGRPRFSVPLEGQLRGLVAERGRLAVALNSLGGAGGTVLVVEEGRVLRSHHFDGTVNALDLRAQHLAVGTSAGRLVLFAPNGTELRNETVGLDVLSLRLSADAQALVAGGYNLTRGAGFPGGVAYLDFRAEPPARWMTPTANGVGLVDLDARGERAIAVEESSPRHRLHAYDAAQGRETWTRTLTGSVALDDVGRGGAALSPDGRAIVVGTLRGSLRAFDAAHGGSLWEYHADGTTTVAFRHTTPPLLVVVQSGPPDTVRLFSPATEPFSGTVLALGGLVAGLLALAGVASLGIGYLRLRRAG